MIFINYFILTRSIQYVNICFIDILKSRNSITWNIKQILIVIFFMLLSRKILPVIVLSTLRTLLISQYLVSIKRAFFFHLRRNIRITEIQAFRFLFIEKFRQNIDLYLCQSCMTTNLFLSVWFSLIINIISYDIMRKKEW